MHLLTSRCGYTSRSKPPSNETRLRAKSDKHSDEDLEIRHLQVRAWKKTGTKVVHDIDTEASLEQTILSVKESIWESL